MYASSVINQKKTTIQQEQTLSELEYAHENLQRFKGQPFTYLLGLASEPTNVTGENL